MLKNSRNLLLGLAGSVLLPVGATMFATPGMAAQTVSLRYGPFQTSVPVADLRQYAQTGEASDRLDTLLSLVSQKQRDDLKKGLNFKAPMNVVAADKLLSSPIGAQLLTRIGKIIVFRPESANAVALQGGVLMAAASQEGLGVMSFLENYPGSIVEIDVKQALKDGGSLGSMFQGLGGGGAPPR
jgi:Alpha/beta hydrolase of unknown function (DUF1400)